MASPVDPLAHLGYSGLRLQGGLEPIRPTTSPIPATNEELAQARLFLINSRITNPSHEKTIKKKTSILGFRREEKARRLADPDTWVFTLHEVGLALAHVFEGSAWESVGVVKGLLATATMKSAEDLWRHNFLPDQHGIRRLIPRIGKFSHPDAPCPWLEKAVQRRVLPVVTVLCHSGMSHHCRNAALVRCLENRDYLIAEELVKFGASFPQDQALYTRAISPGPSAPDFQFIRLWLSSHSPPIYTNFLTTTRAAIASPCFDQRMAAALSLLLANVQIDSHADAHGLLIDAIKAENLEAIAMISLAVGHKWDMLRGEEGSAATNAAAAIANDSHRYRVLGFLVSAGANADTPYLRWLLFENAQRGDIRRVKQLVDFGVAAHHGIPDGESLSPLGWAVQYFRLDILDVIVRGDIPVDAASSALGQLPRSAAERDKIHVVTALRRKGASGMPLSRILLHSVQDSHRGLTDLLLSLGADASYKDSGGSNALLIAVERRDIALIKKLSKASSTATISGEATLRATANRDMDLLELLLSQRNMDWTAGGAAAFHHAAQHGFKPEIDILIRYGAPQDLAASSLQRLVGRGSLDAPESIAIATSLLGAGIPLSARNEALIDAFRNNPSYEELPVEFIRLSILYGAQATAEDFLLFKLAAERSDLRVLEILTTETFPLDLAIVNLIRGVDSAMAISKSVELFLARSQVLGNGRLTWHSHLQLAIQRFPDAAELVRLLLRGGCDPGMDCSPDGTKFVSVLFWAMAESEASREVLLELLASMGAAAKGEYAAAPIGCQEQR
jgi:hypothetical protein